MKIVRHVAPDMRQALRSIRAQLGEDAVILSSRRIPEGVEVTAAVDFDATALQEAVNTPAPAPTAAPLPQPVMLGQPVPMVHAGFTPATAPGASHTRAAPQMPAGAAYATPAHAGPAPPYSQLAGDAAHSHAAASHYFPAKTAADVRPFAHILGADPAPNQAPQASAVARVPAVQVTQHAPAQVAVATPPAAPVAKATASDRREPTLNMAPESDDDILVHLSGAVAVPGGDSLAGRPVTAPVAAGASDTTGTELKTLRRMLETQLAQLAWNDLTRRSPEHVEILRELTEIGISRDLSDYILKQLPEKVDIGAARRFAISGLSQYLRVTGDRWLEDGGRV